MKSVAVTMTFYKLFSLQYAKAKATKIINLLLHRCTFKQEVVAVFIYMRQIVS